MINFLRQVKFLSWMVVPAVAVSVSIFLIPYYHTVSDRLSLRQAQWNAMDHLVSQTLELPGDLPKSSLLGDAELLKIGQLLAVYGIQAQTLEMASSPASAVSFQASKVHFPAWLNALEDLRTQLHLYPAFLVIHATDKPAVVNITGHFIHVASSPLRSSHHLPPTSAAP